MAFDLSKLEDSNRVIEFKRLVMRDVEIKYQEMETCQTVKPLSNDVVFFSYENYLKNRENYYDRLKKEVNAYNDALLTIRNTRNNRLNEERRAQLEKKQILENKKRAQKKAKKTFMYILLVTVVLIIMGCLSKTISKYPLDNCLMFCGPTCLVLSIIISIINSVRDEEFRGLNGCGFWFVLYLILGIVSILYVVISQVIFNGFSVLN